jgi:hypothetical protein
LVSSIQQRLQEPTSTPVTTGSFTSPSAWPTLSDANGESLRESNEDKETVWLYAGTRSLPPPPYSPPYPDIVSVNVHVQAFLPDFFPACLSLPDVQYVAEPSCSWSYNMHFL